MKKNISNTVKFDLLIEKFQELGEIVNQNNTKINPDTSEAEILRQQLKVKEWEIMQHVILSEFRQTKKEIEQCLSVIKLIKKPRIFRFDLIKLDAVFDDFNCTAIVAGVKFQSCFMRINEFYVLQGS